MRGQERDVLCHLRPVVGRYEDDLARCEGEGGEGGQDRGSHRAKRVEGERDSQASESWKAHSSDSAHATLASRTSAAQAHRKAALHVLPALAAVQPCRDSRWPPPPRDGRDGARLRREEVRRVRRGPVTRCRQALPPTVNDKIQFPVATFTNRARSSPWEPPHSPPQATSDGEAQIAEQREADGHLLGPSVMKDLITIGIKNHAPLATRTGERAARREGRLRAHSAA